MKKKPINWKKVKKLAEAVKDEWNPSTLEERIHQLEDRVNRLEVVISPSIPITTGYRGGA